MANWIRLKDDTWLNFDEVDYVKFKWTGEDYMLYFGDDYSAVLEKEDYDRVKQAFEKSHPQENPPFPTAEELKYEGHGFGGGLPHQSVGAFPNMELKGNLTDGSKK